MNIIKAILDIENDLVETAILNTTDYSPNLIRSCFVNDIAHQIHHKVISGLIKLYLQDRCAQYDPSYMSSFFESSESISPNLLFADGLDIPALCEKIHVEFLNSSFEFYDKRIIRKRSKQNIIEKGAVYTHDHICKDMINESISLLLESNNKSVDTLKILDFAAGTGRFYTNIVDILHQNYSIPISDIITNIVHAIDIDPVAVDILRVKALSYFDVIDENILQCVFLKIICRNALISKGLLEGSEPLLDENSDFNGLCHAGFDIVISNPPYLALKVNKANESGATELLQKRIKNQVSYFKTSGQYTYSLEGMLNYYQLSIEKILTMLCKDGQLAIICPSSLFADISTTKLRKHLINKNRLQVIKYYPESVRLFDNVSQATNIFHLQKGQITTSFSIYVSGNSFKVLADDIKRLFPNNYEIPFIPKEGWGLLVKLNSYKRLKDYPEIRNRRGELDLTLFKNVITGANTGYRLVRGKMIKENSIDNLNSLEFVDINNFISRKSVDYLNYDFNKKRLIGQQISNMGSSRRLKFVYCEPTDILGNSCNYISTPCQNTLDKLYALLNSKLLNWRFKVASSNNHINNYELAELPMPDLEKFDIDTITENVNMNHYICKIYGLNDSETQYILNH